MIELSVVVVESFMPFTRSPPQHLWHLLSEIEITACQLNGLSFVSATSITACHTKSVERKPFFVTSNDTSSISNTVSYMVEPRHHRKHIILRMTTMEKN